MARSVVRFVWAAEWGASLLGATEYVVASELAWGAESGVAWAAESDVAWAAESYAELGGMSPLAQDAAPGVAVWASPMPEAEV